MSGEYNLAKDSMPNYEPGKVSIMILSFNQENYISEAIDSAVNQSYKNIEVIVGDDGSTDGTVGIIQDYAKRYPGVVIPVISKENRGITVNCNAALSACTGEYLALQGGDDILLSEKISSQVAWLSAHKNRALCGHQVEIFYESGDKESHSGKGLGKGGIGPIEIMKRGVPASGSSIMVRRDAIPPHGFDEGIKYASDLLFYIEVVMEQREWGFIDGTHARIRRHSNNVTSRRYELIDEVGETYKLVESRYSKYSTLARRLYAEHYLYGYAARLMSDGRGDEARAYLWRSIKARPFYWKSWVRLLQLNFS